MFRFTIRDVLLVMVIVGLAIGWGIDRLHSAKREHGWVNRSNALTDAVRMEGWEIIRSDTHLILEKRNVEGSVIDTLKAAR
jgi:hypothetical protein